MEYWTAFTIGLLGSLHCVGMCGPIALALPYQDKSKFKTGLNVLIYNFGRTITYSIIGIIPGLFGLGIFISGYQTLLSFLLGILLLAIALFSFNIEKQLMQLPALQGFNAWLRIQFSRNLGRKGISSFFGVGLLNGMLPCGLVYAAVAGALTQSTLPAAIIYMMCFGIGTFPLMLILAISGNFLSLKFRRRMLGFQPYFIGFLGILFLLRAWKVELPEDAGFWLLSGFQKMCF